MGEKRMTLSDVRALVSHGYGNSVLRRSALLLCLMGPAFAINFILYYVAAALLSPENFGLIYIAFTISNVLFSGSFVLNIFFTRYFISAIEIAGESAAYIARRRVRALIVRWGALAALACVLVLLGFGRWVGIKSWPIVILIVLDTYSSYVIDVDRAFMQSVKKTIALGSITVIWMALRFAFAVTGMALLGAAWSGLLGVVLAAVVVIAALSLLLVPGKTELAKPLPAMPSVRALVPVILGYASLIAVSNLDVLLTYLLLKDNALGAYSASSVFPKGILVVVTPLLQMLYPMMVGEKRPPDIRLVFQKSTGVIFVLSAALALGVLGFSGVLCGGSWGLRSCQPGPLGYLLISAVPLSVLRALVFYQSARQRDWLAISLLMPAAVYILVADLSGHTIETMAQQFAAFSVALVCYYGGLALLTNRTPTAHY